MMLKTKVMQAVSVSLMLTLILIVVFLTAYGVALLTLVQAHILWWGACGTAFSLDDFSVRPLRFGTAHGTFSLVGERAQ